MRTALPTALIFLLFTFSTQHLITLVESENVLDLYGGPVVPGNLYHILDATDTSRGIEVGETGTKTCPVSVIIGADAKKVIFHVEDEGATSIEVGETTTIEFDEVDECATSAKWNVSIPGDKEYPLVIGPPANTALLQGVFHITESEDTSLSNAYYIAFKLGGVEDYVVMASTPDQSRDIYRVVFCPGENIKKFSVVFEPYKKPGTPPPPPPPSPPPPESSFVPLIRKIVR